jgi:hypothetical protein
MTTPANDDLAYRALDYIREHPAEWNQAKFWCGSTACFAGRVIDLDIRDRGMTGLQPVYSINSPAVEAAKLLGWDLYDADTVFFYMGSDFSELERRVKNVIAGDVQDEDRTGYYSTPSE